MKKLNYYQVHKNKKPKRIKLKNVCRSVRSIKFYFNVVDKMFAVVDKIRTEIAEKFKDSFVELSNIKKDISNIEMIYIYKPSLCPSGVIVSIDSGGGTI